MHLDKFAPVGRWASSGRDRRRFERFAEMCQDLPNRPRFRDEGDEPDVAAARWALERKLLPTRAISLAQAIREVSSECVLPASLRGVWRLTC